MIKNSIKVIGIMIGPEDKDFKLYHMDESSEKSARDVTYTGDGWVGGIENITRYLSIPTEPDSITRFVILYDVSCPNKEQHIKKLLAQINKNKKDDLLPTLISIGHEQSPLNKEITGQVSIIKEVANTGAPDELLRNITAQELNKIKAATTILFIRKLQRVTTSFFEQIDEYLKSEYWNDWQKALGTIGHAHQELNTIKSEIVEEPCLSQKDRAELLDILTSFNKRLLASENKIRTIMDGASREARHTNTTELKSPQIAETNSSSRMNISMMVLGGFIAVAGVLAVAIAFTVLHAATFGTAGLLMAGFGVAAALAGVGLFATGAYKNKNPTSDISLQSNNLLII